MPARRDFTPEQLAARLAREREQARVRMRRLRERIRALRARQDAVRVTPIKEGAVTATPSRTLPYGEPSLLDRVRGVEAILASFEARGYEHNPVFWAKMASAYPALDLELEALKLADWLTEPKNAKRRCSKAFLDNWLKKADADRKARVAAPPSRPVVAGGPYTPPAAFQRNLERTYKAPEDFSPDELARSDAARERVKELLPANLRGRWHR
jgi:hypothetical protein